MRKSAAAHIIFIKQCTTTAFPLNFVAVGCSGTHLNSHIGESIFQKAELECKAQQALCTLVMFLVLSPELL